MPGMRSRLFSLPASKTGDVECDIRIEVADLPDPDRVPADPAREAPAAGDAEVGEHTMAGHRWGHGLDSVMQQLAASTRRKARRDLGST
jgi:hypothetical protein